MLKAHRIAVVLADDHAMVRQSLARVLEDSGWIHVVGQAGDGAEAVELAKTTKPDFVVLEYSMPKMDAPRVIELLLRDKSDLKVLVLAVHENIHYAIKALESGAHGYLIKSAAVEELVEAIETIHSGQIYVSPKVSHEVLQKLRQPRKARTGLEALSQREFDLLRILGAGTSLQECARQMNVSTSTASTYRARVMEKLDLSSTAELIRFALENDVVG